MKFSQPVTSALKLEPITEPDIKRIEKEAEALSLHLCWPSK